MCPGNSIRTAWSSSSQIVRSSLLRKPSFHFCSRRLEGCIVGKLPLSIPSKKFPGLLTAIGRLCCEMLLLYIFSNVAISVAGIGIDQVKSNVSFLSFLRFHQCCVVVVGWIRINQFKSNVCSKRVCGDVPRISLLVAVSNPGGECAALLHLRQFHQCCVVVVGWVKINQFKSNVAVKGYAELVPRIS